MSIYTTTNSGSTTARDWVDRLRWIADDGTETSFWTRQPFAIDSRQYGWFPTMREVVEPNTITWNAELNAEQIEALLKPTTLSVLKDKRSQFCLEQEDSEAEVESDETLPEFLDTFEIKEGEQMDV